MMMAFAALAIAALLVACTGRKHGEPGTSTSGSAAPPSGNGVKLISEVPNGEWRLPQGDDANTRYSPLAQITAGNVANLKVSTTLSTGINRGHEGNPLVVNGTMYIVTPFPNNLIAVDLSKPGGAVKFIYEPHPNPQSMGIACCDVVNRGASYADGKIIYSLLDAHVVAVDAETGKEVWRTKVGNIDIGETTTGPATVVKDKVLIGNSGGELGVRGWVVALDVKTGKEAWRAYNTGPDADVKIGPGFKAFYTKDQGKDLGVATWGPDQWKIGGATVWGWFSYDPALNLVYYGTGNPGPWNPDARPGANKWSTSVFARNADTGEAKWAYQFSEHDAWDYDEIMENVLLDMQWQGRMRKLLVHPGRSGFVFVLDRETGELLSAEKFVESTNWARGFDLTTGLAQEDPSKRTHFGTVVQGICPSSTGAKEFVPSSFSPRTNLLYIPAHNTCMDYEGAEANYIAGTPYLGANVKMYPGPGGWAGAVTAWDIAKARPVWSVKEPKFPVYSGILATGGDVVFYGTMDGWFKALDARTGTELWKFKVASGIVGNPITYIGPDGKQYIAVYSGIGGWMGAVAFPTISTDDPYAALGVVGAMKDIKTASAPGSVLYVFSL
jgi:PQQ-dependent dehydrogenase (methanol/ethanol family)